MSLEQKRCKFPIKLRRCGSYAFNLHQDDIDQGDFCDTHYWEDKYHEAKQDLSTLKEELEAGSVPMSCPQRIWRDGKWVDE